MYIIDVERKSDRVCLTDLKMAGLRDITVVKDLAGLDRVVMGRK